MSSLPRSRRFTLTVPSSVPASATPWQWVLHLFAIGGPIGFIPWVPATFASLATAIVARLLIPRLAAVLAATAVIAVAGALAASASERLLQVEDPRNVVIDEVAGQLLTFLCVAPTSWRIALAGFMLFRVFDVWKPPPVNFAERLPRGWGIMADDLVAGLYAALALWLLRRGLALS